MKKKKNKNKKLCGGNFVRQLKTKRTKKTLDIPNALNQAKVYHSSGFPVQAKKIYSEILLVDPLNVTCIYHLGLITQQLGNIDDGIELFKKAISLQPDFVDGHISLANALLQIKDSEGAATSYKNAISLNPDLAMVHNNLGNILKDQGNLKNSIESYHKAISIMPDFAGAYYNLGKALHMNDDLEAAIASYKKALSIKPDQAVVYNNLGNVFKDQGDLVEAIKCYNKATSLQPDYAEAFYNLGFSYYIQGDMDSAKKCCIEAKTINPDLTEAHRILSRIIKYTKNDVHILEMEKLIAQKNITDVQAMHLAFALGKAYEDCGDYEKSFFYLKRGNSLKRKTYEYSTDDSKKFFAQIKRVDNNLSHSLLRQDIKSNPLPIFILGMPRSGTSLVEQILASHQDVYGAGELKDFQKIFLQETQSICLEEAYVTLLSNSENILSNIRLEYNKILHKRAGSMKFVTDKMPYNFLCVGLIHYAFPEARIIHCTRDPMDNCFSIFKNYFEGNHLYAYDMKELALYYILYQDLMHYWRDTFPDSIYTIKYEKLVDNPKEEIQMLLDYCNLQWQEKCLSFHKTARVVATASAAQVRKPIYKDSVHLWKKYEDQLHDISGLLL